ncbi:hypothetical protein NCCP2145_02770 [Pseudarthrobacter sp. NCCP-2145]|nr:hypothetical protein NCCP2145_02770 [Pseudarthrobacter sp. NCCP-2145]
MDYHSDAPLGTDPDRYSPTLRKRHQTAKQASSLPFLVVDGFPVDGLQRGEPCFHFGLLTEVFQGGELGIQG